MGALHTAFQRPSTPAHHHCQAKPSQVQPGTMQSADANFSRSSLSLLLALSRYNDAVHDMEQTVLLPSLLRDVSPDDAWDSQAADESSKDLYENYLMLKAIRTTMECGMVAQEGQRSKITSDLNKSLEPLLMETDPEALFQFHLRGLFSVMNNLTKKTHGLTNKYLDIIGGAQ